MIPPSSARRCAVRMSLINYSFFVKFQFWVLSLEEEYLAYLVTKYNACTRVWSKEEESLDAGSRSRCVKSLITWPHGKMIRFTWAQTIAKNRNSSTMASLLSFHKINKQFFDRNLDIRKKLQGNFPRINLCFFMKELL